MPKRLIVPVKASITVVGGIGFLLVPEFAGVMRYLVVEGPTSTAKGRVIIHDPDESQDIYRDPRKSTLKVDLEFYHQPVEIPLNGPLNITLDQADDGNYTVYYVLEERPRRV